MMLSFNSETIDKGTLQKLRSELCRMPIKPNSSGLFELYTKAEMKTKFKIDSPNLADSIMMLQRQPYSQIQTSTGRPKPIRPIGRR
jgi:phage terminase large subunit